MRRRAHPGDQHARRGEQRRYLDQQRTATDIVDTFGTGFTYVTDSGNLAIEQTVLHQFRRLTEDVAVWSRSERYWRRRVPGDGPGQSLSLSGPSRGGTRSSH